MLLHGGTFGKQFRLRTAGRFKGVTHLPPRRTTKISVGEDDLNHTGTLLLANILGTILKPE